MKVKNYFRPGNVEEFQGIVTEYPNYKILAGGTYVAKMDFPKIDTIIDIQNIDLTVIDEGAENLEIGAGVTFSRLMETELKYGAGIIQKVSSHCGPLTIRNIATIGGNVMAGYHWNDTTPLLLALDAVLVFQHGEVSIGEFLEKRAEYNGKLLLKILLPKKHAHENPFYSRFARTESDIPTSIFLVTGKEEKYATAGAALVKPVKIRIPNSGDPWNDVLLPEFKRTKFMDDLRGDALFKEKILLSQYREWKER